MTFMCSVFFLLTKTCNPSSCAEYVDPSTTLRLTLRQAQGDKPCHCHAEPVERSEIPRPRDRSMSLPVRLRCPDGSKLETM